MDVGHKKKLTVSDTGGARSMLSLIFLVLVAPLNKLKHCSNLQDEKLDPAHTGNLINLRTYRSVLIPLMML